MEPYEKNQSLIVINWNLALLRVCGRRNMYYVPADYSRNLDCLMLFKKNCNNAIKFATKNIPFALIQVCLLQWQWFIDSNAKKTEGTKGHSIFLGRFCGCLFLWFGVINGSSTDDKGSRWNAEPYTCVCHSWLHSFYKRHQSKPYLVSSERATMLTVRYHIFNERSSSCFIRGWSLAVWPAIHSVKMTMISTSNSYSIPILR